MAGVYISFPFCPHKCSFCNFSSGVFPRGLEQEYGIALVEELRHHQWLWRPDTVYLGGGTPSQMEPELLASILENIPGRPWREATIEALPGTLTRESITQWLKLGITRVSLGVQSFVAAELASTGRRHEAAGVFADCELLRGAGIENISLDLIAGLPGQTAESWEISLDWVERIQPPHASVYLLEIDEESRLGLEVLKGGPRFGANELPSEDLAADLYERATLRLRNMGLARYEISNFAKPGFESVHNLKYWEFQPYRGFGVDAHSFDGRWRRANADSLHEYLRRVRAGETVLMHEEEAKPDEERFFIGLRLLQGVELGTADWERHAGRIDRFIDVGLIEREGSRLRFTARGILLSNEVLREFVNP